MVDDRWDRMAKQMRLRFPNIYSENFTGADARAMVESRPTHNHITRWIAPYGQCPACDDYHDRHDNDWVAEKFGVDV